jgi:glycosyltransferase involved in cell wall biosynthesis
VAAFRAVRPQALLDVHQIGLGETGNETWARSVLGILEGHQGEQQGGGYHYAVSPAGAAAVGQLVPTDRVHVVSGRSSRRLAFELPALLRRVKPAVVLAQYTLPLTRTPGVVVVHDISFERPEARVWVPTATLWRYRATIGASVRRASVVVVPTEYTRDDVVERYHLDPARVLLAPLAPDLELAVLPRTAPPRDYRTVLCVGTVLPRKNLLVVAKAVAALRARGEDVRLRVVGPVRPAGEADVEAMRALLGTALEVTGPVPGERLAIEYQQADMLAFPSLFEGFGLPLLEAMAAGVPVVSSDATCLPEVAGQAALLVPPSDERAWADALGAVLAEPALAQRLARDGSARAATYTWERTAAVVRQALDLAAG